MDRWMAGTIAGSGLSRSVFRLVRVFHGGLFRSQARKALNPLIYLAVVFDMELMRPGRRIMSMGPRLDFRLSRENNKRGEERGPL